MAGALGAGAQTTFSSESSWDDGTNLYYQATYTGSFAHFEVFLDTDNNAATGYTINGIGADYLLEDTNAYKSTANGSGWSWSASIATVTVTGTGTVKLAVPLSALGSPASAKVGFQVLDASWVPTVDPHVVTYTKSSVTFSGESATNDTTNFYYQANYTGTWPHFDVFIDTDNNAATGYTVNGIGADYLLEDTNVYKSTANGSSWSWGASLGTVTDTIGSGTVKLAVALSLIGSPASAKVAFQVQNASWVPTLDPHVVTFTKSGGTAPGAPSSLAATAGNTQVSLTWAAGSGATSYNIYRGTTAGGESTTAIATGVTSTSYTNTGLTNGTTYYYKVKSVNASGTSAYSNEASATPAAAAPGAPSGLSASAGNTQVSLTWAAGSGATSYNVYRGTTAGGESTTAIATGITSTSYTNTGLTNGTTYYYKVKSVNASGTSAYSNEASATPAAAGGSAFYVSPSGNDANAGTLASPWKTGTKAGNSATPGSTVYFRAGTYGQFDINVSGNSSAGYITFTNYPGETAIVDGTGYTGSFDHGLIHCLDRSYIKIVGFEVRNGSSTSSSFGPVGIFVQSFSNAGSNIQVLSNYVHNITNTAASNGNAHGILVRGEDAAHVLNNITVSGNQIANCKTGWSENLTVSGNVQTFTVSNNTVHDNNNIGIDCTGGYSGVAGGAQARNGTVSGNTVYNCSTLSNPYYNTYTCAGLYVDGGTQIVMERNTVHNCDYGIELSAEIPGIVTSFVTVRSNIVYNNSAFGLGIGGYAASGTGGTDHCTIVNNTFYNDDTLNWWIGEWHCGWRATNNVFTNNIVYAGSGNDNFFKDEGTDGASVGTFDYNQYYSAGGDANAKWQWINQTSWTTTFASWKSVSGQDAHSTFGDPGLVSPSTGNFDTTASSTARNSGNNLGTTIEGTQDYAGATRVNGTIDKGAYEH